MARMSAVEEMAGMDILCSDKTGTLTLNQLSVDKNTVLVTMEGLRCEPPRLQSMRTCKLPIVSCCVVLSNESLAAVRRAWRCLLRAVCRMP